MTQKSNFIPGELAVPDRIIKSRLKKIRLLAFDWDGIFNNGEKSEIPSTFNEIDSMGINMLRFGFYLMNLQNPVTTIVTGEKNKTAVQWARREHFHSVYFHVKNKADVLKDFQKKFSITSEEVLFVFDDIHDISLAEKAGVRMMVQNPGSRMLVEYCRKKGYFDYLTSYPGGQFALREISEVLLFLMDQFNNTVKYRISFESEYLNYWKIRNQVETKITGLTY